MYGTAKQAYGWESSTRSSTRGWARIGDSISSVAYMNIGQVLLVAAVVVYVIAKRFAGSGDSAITLV